MNSIKNLDAGLIKSESVTRKVTFGPRALIGLKESLKKTIND